MGKIIAILKFGILISLLILFISASTTDKNHCGTCEFRLEGEKMSASEFVNDYFGECIDPYVKKDTYNKDFDNYTFESIKPTDLNT